MAADTTHYVRLFRRFTGRGTTGRWDTILATCDTNPRHDGTLNADTTIACFEVHGAATTEAARGVVAEWLYLGRPSSMTVTEIHRTVENASAASPAWLVKPRLGPVA